MDELQTLTADDVGRMPASVLDAATPDTPLELMLSTLAAVTNAKVWALAKAESTESRITVAGGAVPPALQAVLDAIRAAAK